MNTPLLDQALRQHQRRQRRADRLLSLREERDRRGLESFRRSSLGRGSPPPDPRARSLANDIASLLD